MDIPKEVNEAMFDILEHYEFSKREQLTIALFIQTLNEYSTPKPKEKKDK